MIYDCFPFNDELELLEIRLNHHSSFVDKFVLSESMFTYSGHPKRLYYDRVKDQKPFARFKDKIIHLIYRRPPDRKESNWEYEYSQRDNLLQMMPIFKDSDLIIYLDCDEMIRDKVVIDEAIKLRCIVSLEMKLCWYYFNCIVKSGSKFQSDYSMERCFNHRWHMGKICRKVHLKQFSTLYRLRQFHIWDPRKVYTIFNSGWHFSNLGNPTVIYNKFISFSHSNELKNKYNFSPELIQKRKAQLIDPLGRNVSFVATELDVPQFILDNAERYKEYILNVADNQKS